MDCLESDMITSDSSQLDCNVDLLLGRLTLYSLQMIPRVGAQERPSIMILHRMVLFVPQSRSTDGGTGYD